MWVWPPPPPEPEPEPEPEADLKKEAKSAQEKVLALENKMKLLDLKIATVKKKHLIVSKQLKDLKVNEKPEPKADLEVIRDLWC